LGGVAIVCGFYAPLVGLLLVDSGVGLQYRQHPELILGLFGGGLVVAALGLYDDLRGAGAKLKFLVQFGVATALYLLGMKIELIATPFGGAIPLGPLALPFTLLWVVGVINAMNLIDGLDGLAGGVAFFGVATNFILALVRGDVVTCLMMGALAGAVLGFLIFNFNPASIFMGDTGSMFLGFVLATVSIKTSTKSGTAVAMLVPIIALGLPIMDTLLAMLRRSMLGRPVFSADKEHIHHRVMSRFFLSQRGAVLVLYGICCLFCLTALALSYANSAQSAMLLGGIGVVVVVLMRKLGYLSLRSAAGVGEARRKNIQLRALVRDLNDRIAVAHDLQGLWDAVRPLAEAVDASALELKLQSGEGDLRDQITFDTSRPVGSALPFHFAVEVKLGDDTLGVLSLSWRDGRAEMNRDEELALELASDSIAKAVGRIWAVKAADPAKVVALRG
jgi:UDP-GlcNAc:undecaprenyl-phosphate GlcNAc-1-phosphate transferase